jgi:hypothetical protein
MSENEQPEPEALASAARLLSSKRTEASREASRANQRKAAAARTGKPLTDDHRAKLCAAQKARWERVRAERGEATEPKRPRGRPLGSKGKPIQTDTAPGSATDVVLDGKPGGQND